MKTLILILALLSTPALAGEWSIDFSFASRHFNRSDVSNYNLNEHNFGLGFTHTENRAIQTFGIYTNSLNKTSFYGLFGYSIFQTKIFRAGVLGGLVSGYQSDIAAGAFASFTFKSARLNFIAVPPPTKNTWGDGFIALQLQYVL